MSSLKHCSSSFSRTNCICILLMEIRSSHRTLGSCYIRVPEMVSHVTSPLAWIFFLREFVSPHDNLIQCWKMASTQKGKNLAFAYFLVMGHLHGHWLSFHLMSAQGAHVRCRLVRPPYLLIHFLPPALERTHGPFHCSLCSLGGVVKTRSTDGIDRIFITFFKCQITTTQHD